MDLCCFQRVGHHFVKAPIHPINLSIFAVLLVITVIWHWVWFWWCNSQWKSECPVYRTCLPAKCFRSSNSMNFNWIFFRISKLLTFLGHVHFSAALQQQINMCWHRLQRKHITILKLGSLYLGPIYFMALSVSSGNSFDALFCFESNIRNFNVILIWFSI